MLTALNASGLAIALALLALLASRRPRLSGDAWIYAWIGANILLFVGMMLAANASGVIGAAGTLSVQLAVSAMAPALYLFGVSITTGRLTARQIWIAASPVIVTGMFFLSLMTLPIELVDGEIRVLAPSPFLIALPLVTILFNASLPVVTLKRLHDYRTGFGRAPSKAVQSDLGWSKVWAYAHLTLLGISLGGFVLTLAGALSGSLQLLIILAAQAVLLAFVGYHGLTRSHVFFATDQSGWRALRVSGDRQVAKADFEAVQARLQDIDIHTNSELSSAIFADQMGWGKDRLNEAVRAGGSTSFSTLVNTLRVETVKRWMCEPAYQKTAVLTLGLDAGFKSKSAFYDAFKSAEGISPGRWKASHASIR